MNHPTGSSHPGPSPAARLLPALLGLGLAACVAEDDLPELGMDEAESQCGSTWDAQHVESYDGTLGVGTPFVARHQRRVGYQVPLGCTGTLISDDLFLSAGHCTYAVGQSVRFNYQNIPGGGARPTQDFAVTAIVEQEYASGWDYAIVRLANSPGRTYGHAQIAAIDPPVGSNLTLIMHPSHEPKQVSTGPVFDFPHPNYFRYQADQQGGSSGGAMLDNNGEIVGINTNHGCNTTAPIDGNWAQRMSALVPHSPTLQTLTRSKVLWRNAPGNQASIWSVNADGTQHADSGAHSVGADWTPLSLSNNRVLWRHDDGRSSYWTINDAGQHLTYAEYGPWAGWTPVNHANDRVLWRHSGGMAWLWTVNSVGQYVNAVTHGPFAGWTAIAYDTNKLLWRHTDGSISIWTIDDAGAMVRSVNYAVPTTWTFVNLSNDEIMWRDTAGATIQYLINPLSDTIDTIAYGPYSPFVPVHAADRKIIWRLPSGLMSYWTINSDGQYMRYREHGPFGTWMATLTAGGRPN